MKPEEKSLILTWFGISPFFRETDKIERALGATIWNHMNEVQKPEKFTNKGKKRIRRTKLDKSFPYISRGISWSSLIWERGFKEEIKLKRSLKAPDYVINKCITTTRPSRLFRIIFQVNFSYERAISYIMNY